MPWFWVIVVYLACHHVCGVPVVLVHSMLTLRHATQANTPMRIPPRARSVSRDAHSMVSFCELSHECVSSGVSQEYRRLKHDFDLPLSSLGDACI